VAEARAETGEYEYVPIEPRSFMAVALISPTAHLAR
jgi:hypothetical protein